MQQPPPLPASNPYAAPTAHVQDVNDAGALELADRGARLGAAILDGLVVIGPMALLGIGAAILIPSQRNETGEPAYMMLGLIGFVAIVVIVGIAVVNLVWLHRYGQSIAKRWLKIRIVRSDGSRCSLLRIIFARVLPMGVLGAIPYIGNIVGLVDALFIFRSDYRCLHDHIADTIVVKA